MGNFYKDQNSQNIFLEIVAIADKNKAPQIEELTANTTDAAQEKHVPVVTINGNSVEVSIGSVSHPMLEEHSITVIFIETKMGGQYRRLTPGEEPKAVFTLEDGDEFVAAYEYCNLHGLWKAGA